MSRKIVIVSILLTSLFLGGCVITPGLGVNKNGVPIGLIGGGHMNHSFNPDQNSSAHETRGYNPAKHPHKTFNHAGSIRVDPVTGHNPYMEQPMHQFPSTNQY